MNLENYTKEQLVLVTINRAYSYTDQVIVEYSPSSYCNLIISGIWIDEAEDITAKIEHFKVFKLHKEITNLSGDKKRLIFKAN